MSDDFNVRPTSPHFPNSPTAPNSDQRSPLPPDQDPKSVEPIARHHEKGRRRRHHRHEIQNMNGSDGFWDDATIDEFGGSFQHHRHSRSAETAVDPEMYVSFQRYTPQPRQCKTRTPPPRFTPGRYVRVSSINLFLLPNSSIFQNRNLLCNSGKLFESIKELFCVGDSPALCTPVDRCCRFNKTSRSICGLGQRCQSRRDMSRNLRLTDCKLELLFDGKYDHPRKHVPLSYYALTFSVSNLSRIRIHCSSNYSMWAHILLPLYHEIHK